MYHSTPGRRVTKKKKKIEAGLDLVQAGVENAVLRRPQRDVHHLHAPHPFQFPPLGLCLGPWDGPRAGVVSCERGTLGILAQLRGSIRKGGGSLSAPARRSQPARTTM